MNIELQNLSKSYFLNGKEIPVLKDLSFTIDGGNLVSLTGPSGAGKSTLLHLLGTLDKPSHGSIRYDGCEVKVMSDARIAEFRNLNIGFVFQFHHLMGEFNAVENVMMPLLMRRESSSRADEKARELLSFVGLSHRTEHKPGELSGGEQQRVALARALVSEPKVLLADEPTGNLDEDTGLEIVELIKRYNKETSATILLVTHNQRVAGLFRKRLNLDRHGILWV